MDRDPVVNAPTDLEVATQAAWSRNRYYRDGFFILMRVVNIQALVMVLLAAGLFLYVDNTRKIDRFFAETANGRRMQIVGLDMPNMGRIALDRWVASAVTEVLTFGFNDIDQRFALSQRNFTAKGWDNFYKAMSGSDLVNNLLKYQQVITAVLQGPPVLVQEGLIQGVYSWVFDAQVLLTFRSGGVTQTNLKTVHIVVRQVPTRDNPNGVGIEEWYVY